SSDKVFGSAPGYCAVTTIVGGVISGNCATGKSVKAMQPKSTVTTEMTIAKIGRSIKKCDNFMFFSLNYGPEFPFLLEPKSTVFYFEPSRGVAGSLEVNSSTLPCCAFTGLLGRTLMIPFKITTSSGCNPDFTTRNPLASGPTVMRRRRATFPESTT